MFSFYVDESGTPNIAQTAQPWYVLLAVGLNDDDWSLINNSVNALKRKYFPTWDPVDVEVKSNRLRRAKTEQWPPNAFSTLSTSDLTAFCDDLYSTIDTLPFEFCAVALDKTAVVQKHGVKDAHGIFKQAYVLLIERLHGWCKRKGTFGRVFIDQQEHNLLGAVHDVLITEHHDLIESGTPWQETSRIIERPYFQDSKHCNHVQLADVLAYNIYRRLVRDDPNYAYFIRTMNKVRGHRRPDGEYYGLKIYAPK